MTEPTGEAMVKLTAMRKDWEDAEKRFQMAQQTLMGAQADMISKEARFKGAAELVLGSADWGFEFKDGKLKFIPPALAKKKAIERAKAKKK